MRLFTLLSLAALLAPGAGAQIVPAVIVVAEGESVPVSGGGTATIEVINAAFTDGAGTPGFAGQLDAGGGNEGFVWYDDAVRFRNSDAAGSALTGAEFTMGVGDGGAFVFSPSVDGEDACWTDDGLLARRTQPAVGAPGEFYSFCSRPTMRPDGAAYWVSGLAATPTGSTQRDALYVSSDGTPATTALVYAVPAPLDGQTTDDLAFDYTISHDGSHVVLQVSFTGSTTADDAVVLDGAVVAREGSSTGDGDNWGSFDLVKVNDAGLLLFSGDTGGATATDEFIARTSGGTTTIPLREGDAVDGVTLGSTVRGLGLSSDGVVAWAWTAAAPTTDELLFVGTEDNLAASQLVLRTGFSLDTDGDMDADYTVTDFDFSDLDGQGAFDLADDRMLYLPLELEPAGGGNAVVALVGIDLSGYLPTATTPPPTAAAVALTAAPNPFSASAAVTLSLDRAQTVRVELRDALGRHVAVLHDGPLAAGSFDLTLEGADLAPGAYLVRALGEGWSRTARVTRF